jgi:hypothetical protein
MLPTYPRNRLHDQHPLTARSRQSRQSINSAIRGSILDADHPTNGVTFPRRNTVKTLNLVAKELGEDENWLFDVAAEMEPEDGVIWVYGMGDDGVLAFTDFGVESLVDLIKMHKDDPSLLRRAADET